MRIKSIHLGIVAAIVLGAVTPGHTDATTSVSGTLAVVNKAANSLSVVDIESAAIIAELPTGRGPHEAILAPDQCRVVVTNYVGGDSLSVFDICTLDALMTIDLAAFPGPHGLEFVASGNEVAVTSERSQQVVRVDIDTGKILGAIDTTYGSHMLALAGQRGFSTNGGADNVTEFTLDTGTAVAHHPVDPRPEAIAVTNDGREVWVGSNAAGTVTVLDPIAQTTRSVATGFGWPYRIVFTPDERRVLIPDLRRERLRIFERASGTELADIDLTGGLPQGVAVHPNGRYVFQALNREDRVAVIDLVSYTVVRYLPTGSRPDGIVYAPVQHRAGSP